MTDNNDPDGALIVAYVSGELDEPARVAFESRLTAEPDLARRHDEYLELDLAGEALRADALRRRRRTELTGVFAAAAGIAAALLLWFGTGNPEVRFEVTPVVTRGADSLADYAESLGIDGARQVPGGTSRGSGDPTQARGVDDYLRALRDAEAKRDAELFATPTREVEADFITLRFRPATDCSAVVLELDSTGKLRRRYPTASFVFGAAENRFTKGQVHVLPRPVAIAAKSGRISTHPGFDIPSDLTIPRIWLLLALRTAAIPDELLSELDAQLESASGKVAMSDLGSATPAQREALADRAFAPVHVWLRDHGFSLQRISATAPR